MRAVVEFLPGSGLIAQALDNYGAFERAGGWVEQPRRTLGLSGDTIREAINRFLDSLSWRDIVRLGSVWGRARRIFTDPIDRIVAFARSLGGAVLRFIKDAILRPLVGLASRTRGRDLRCAVLGQNPITGEAVPRNAETLIGGLMRLIGEQEIWQNIHRAGAVPRVGLVPGRARRPARLCPADNVVNRARQPIDLALDRVVDGLVARARRLGRLVAGSARRIVEWWRRRQSYRNAAGERHTLQLSGSGDRARPMIATELQTVESHLAQPPNKNSPDYRAAASTLGGSKRIIYSFARPDAAAAERRDEVVNRDLARLGAVFARLAGQPPTNADYPTSTEPQYSGPPATSNSVRYIVGEPEPGGRPTQGEDHGTPGGRRVRRAGLTRQSDRWVQMHVISEQLGGKGQPNNLISAPGSINTGYFRSFELATRNLAAAVSGGIKSVVWVSVTVSWRNAELAATISDRSGLYVWRGRQASPEWLKNEV